VRYARESTSEDILNKIQRTLLGIGTGFLLLVLATFDRGEPLPIFLRVALLIGGAVLLFAGGHASNEYERK
jgi:hypothetical protein